MSTFYERELGRKAVSDTVQMFPDGVLSNRLQREREAHNSLLQYEIDRLEVMLSQVPDEPKHQRTRDGYITQLCLKRSQLK